MHTHTPTKVLAKFSQKHNEGMVKIFQYILILKKETNKGTKTHEMIMKKMKHCYAVAAAS